MAKKLSSFEAMSNLITNILSKYKNEALTKANCMMMYQDIFGAVVDTVQETGLENILGNEALNWAAQAFYDMVTINGNQELDPSIFTQRAKLENVPTKDLALLCAFFHGHEIAAEIAHYMNKKRG